MYQRIGLTALIAMAAMAINAFAADKAQESNTVYSLGEVVVTAPEVRGVERIATLHEITADEIEMRGARTLDKALELLPGLDIRRGARGVPRVNLRGMRSRHVVLLLNGIPFNSTYDGQFDPSTISTENIARIKVSYGSHSVLYGQGGLGGVINIITRKGSKKTSGSVAVDIIERGDYAAQARISGGTEKSDFFMSLSRQDSNGFVLPDDFEATDTEDGGIRENSDAERNNIFANLGITVSDHLLIGVVAGGNQGEYGQPPSTGKKPKYRRIEDYNGQFGQVSLGYDPQSMFGLRAWAYANTSEQDLVTYKDDSYEKIKSEQNDEIDIFGATVQSSFTPQGYGKLTFSLNSEKNEYNDTQTADSSHEIDLLAAAAEYEIALFDRLGFVAGYSHHWQNKDQGEDDDKGTWLLGLTFDPFENTRVRASYARKIRFASIKNLYGDGGNEDLTTENSNNIEVGITQLLPWGIIADVAVFQNDVENYIEKDEDDIYQNHDKYRFKGIDITLSRSFGNGGLSLGYSWMEAKDKSEGSSLDDLEYRPDHKITLQGNYTFDCGLTIYADLMRVMGQVYYSGSTQNDLPDYTLVDVKLEKSFHNNLFVYIGANNLFDEAYEESDGFPQAGRTAYAGMRVVF